MSLKTKLRSAGLGRLAYRLWHQPRARVREIMAAGGPLEVRRTELGRREMEAAAHHLPPIREKSHGPPVHVYLLTGKKHWYQTAFCLWTFARHSGCPVAPVIFDDGSLNAKLSGVLMNLFPGATIVPRVEIVERLDAGLPAARFPTIRERWADYPIIRKFIATHFGSTGWKLILDSDMLFFRKPEFLIDWVRTPTRRLHAVDVATNYGYSRTLLNSLAPAPVAEKVNAGIYGLPSEAIDWEHIEFIFKRLVTAEGKNYFLEQALLCILMAGQDCAIVPACDYVTLPVLPEAEACQAVLHHYVADSKKWYFRHCWRKALNP